MSTIVNRDGSIREGCLNAFHRVRDDQNWYKNYTRCDEYRRVIRQLTEWFEGYYESMALREEELGLIVAQNSDLDQS